MISLILSLALIAQHVTTQTHNLGMDLVFSMGVNVDHMSVEPTPVSDNFCIFFSIYFHVSKSSDPITYSYLRIDNAAKSRMVRALPDILSSCCALTSLDDQTDSFNSALTAVLNSAAPLKTRRQTQTKAAPWFNDETHKLVNSSKSTTCSLDPIPTNLFKELLPTLLSLF